jgi:carboxyl-terminal processing protease
MIRTFLFSLIFSVLASSLYSGPITIDKSERDQLKKETVYAIDLIQRYHYKQTSFSDIDSEELLKAYMDDLDRTRMFFLQEDIDFAVERFGSSLKSSYLYIGDLYPAFEIFNVYYERISDRIVWIKERLQEPFDFESDAEYLTDRSEADWPENAEAADLLWEQRLTNELIMELLEDQPMEIAIEKISKRYDRMQKFLDEIEVHNVQETFITSLAQLYDPHSNFFSWDSAQEFDIQISNALVGIGAQLRDVDGYCVIESLIPGGPAEMTGKLHPGDKIIAVAQGDEEPVDVVDMKLRKIVQQIRGESGTEVRLTVIPAHSAKRKIVSLIREKIEMTANLASGDLYELPDASGETRKIGVIELPSFYGEGAFGKDSISTSKDVEELIEKFKKEKVDGLVLDLRNNGGGRLDEAVKLTGLFISEGPVVMKKTFSGEVEEDWDRNPKVAWEGPLVVLVSHASASASEIVAGALQSLGRAVIVGDESTHGKGTVQAPIDLRTAMQRLPMGHPLEVGTVKITVQQFYLPNGDSTQNRGVLSDIPLPSANMFLFEGEADLDHALSWDQIEPIAYELPERKSPDFALAKPDVIETLKTLSETRQIEFEEFAYLQENIDWYKERHDMETVSLNLELRRIEKDELEIMRDYFDTTRDELSKSLNYTVQSVDLAITDEKEQAHQLKLANTLLPNGEARVNQFYQKVFYYKSPTDDKIHEIWVEYFDYDKALDQSESIAVVLSEAYDQEITLGEMNEILTRFKNIDRASGFDVLNPFRDVLGANLDEQAMLKAMPAFFTKMVEVDPDVLLERAKFDVPLRESLRIVRDWVDIESPLDPANVAMAVAKKDEEAAPTTENTP